MTAKSLVEIRNDLGDVAVAARFTKGFVEPISCRRRVALTRKPGRL